MSSVFWNSLCLCFGQDTVRPAVGGSTERGAVLPGDAPDLGEDAARRRPAERSRALDGAAVDACGGACGHSEYGGRRGRAGPRAAQESRGGRADRRDRPDQKVLLSCRTVFPGSHIDSLFGALLITYFNLYSDDPQHSKFSALLFSGKPIQSNRRWI